jgi:hypothetical protein
MPGKNARKKPINNENGITELIEKNEMENSALKKVLDFLEVEAKRWLIKQEKLKQSKKDCENT